MGGADVGVEMQAARAEGVKLSRAWMQALRWERSLIERESGVSPVIFYVLRTTVRILCSSYLVET